MDTAEIRVLVVEDYPSMGVMIARILSGAGYSVRSALSGAAALKLCEQEDFDLAVIDIRLPDMDGWELFTELRKRHSLRGVACTTCAAPEDIVRSHALGFDAHMTKPIQLDELLRVVAGVAERGRAEPLSATGS